MEALAPLFIKVTGGGFASSLVETLLLGEFGDENSVVDFVVDCVEPQQKEN